MHQLSGSTVTELSQNTALRFTIEKNNNEGASQSVVSFCKLSGVS